MEEWIPLYVAGVAAFAAIGVAFWNSRGESAELRQLKSLNDAIAGMSGSGGAPPLVQARDELATRVAARISAAPARRRITWIVVWSVSALVVGSGLTVLFAPSLPKLFAGVDLLGLVPVLIGLATGVFSLVLDRSARKAAVIRPRSAAAPGTTGVSGR